MNTLPRELQTAIREFELELGAQRVCEAFSLSPDEFAPHYAQWLQSARAFIDAGNSSASLAMNMLPIHSPQEKAGIFTAVFCAAMYQRRPDAHKTKPLREYLDALIAEK